MQYFDLHCDTLYEAVKKKSALNNPDFEVNIIVGKKFNKWCQCFAVWIPDGIPQEERLSLIGKAHDTLKRATERLDLKQFDKNGKDESSSYIFTLENASVINGNIDNVKMLLDYGIKMVTLTWNDKNCIGGGSNTPESGLSDFGKRCVKSLEENGIIIDISHSSDKTFYDVFENTTQPLVASHSNSRKICSHRRNLSDEQFSEIVKRKGIVGINFHKDFLNNNRDKASIADVINHIDHFLSLGGENILCIGSDFDGADPIQELSDISKIPNLYEILIKTGYNEQLVQKILYNNAYNFFSRF